MIWGMLLAVNNTAGQRRPHFPVTLDWALQKRPVASLTNGFRMKITRTDPVKWQLQGEEQTGGKMRDTTVSKARNAQYPSQAAQRPPAAAACSGVSSIQR